MTQERRENDYCTQIGYWENTGGVITGREFLVFRGGDGQEKHWFSISVTSAPPHSIEEGEIPVLSLRSPLMGDPDQICHLLQTAPWETIEPYLVPELLPEDLDPQ